MNWAGTHHLIGGPLPRAFGHGSENRRRMMIVCAVIHGCGRITTCDGGPLFSKLTPGSVSDLRLLVFGCDVVHAGQRAKFVTACDTVTQTGHFTHYQIAHAHLGVYSVLTMIAFRFDVTYGHATVWWSGNGISRSVDQSSFSGCCAIGIGLYWIGLSIEWMD